MSDSSHIDYFCLPIGYKVGGYTIRDIIGYGGFGITYAVYDEGLDNDYVLKENMPRFFCSRDSTTKQVTAPAVGEMADGYAWATERFKDEARTLAKLKHPGIVRVLRSFDALGTSYYVMDKIDGQELDRATENRRDEAFLRHILRRLLHALQYLHQKNIPEITGLHAFRANPNQGGTGPVDGSLRSRGHLLQAHHGGHPAGQCRSHLG